MSAQSPELPLSHTGNEKTEIAEMSQTSTAAPHEKPGGRVMRDDREKQPIMGPDSGKSGGSPSPDMRADEGRSAMVPPKGGMATGGAEKSSFNQQVPPGGPSSDDKLAKTAGEKTGAPKTPAYPSTSGTSDEQPEKSSTKSEMAPETTPRKIPPADSRSTSAPVEEVTTEGQVKQGPAGRGGILDVQDIGGGDATEKTGITADESTKAALPALVQAPSSHGDGDTTKKLLVDKTAAEPSSQQTKEPTKGVGPTLQGITGDVSTKAAPTGLAEEPAFGEQNSPTALHRGTPDRNGKEGVETSPGDPRGMHAITQERLAPIPATQLPTASGKMPAQSPELPLSHTGNDKTEIAENSQTSTAAPHQKPGVRVLRDAGEPSSGSLPMKTQEYVKEQDDQSGAELVDNRMRQGDGVAQIARTDKRKEDDYIADADDKNNRKAQATTIDTPSKPHIQSGKNQGITGDESKVAPTGPGNEPSFGEHNTPTVPHGGTPDNNGKEGIKTSSGDPRGMLPTTQGRPAPIPATQLTKAPGKMSAQSPELPLSYTRNEKAEIAEASQTSMAAPNEKPSGRVLRNGGGSSSGSSAMKSQEFVNEQDDQSGAKSVENRVRQGDDVAQTAGTSNRKEEDYITNANDKSNRKAQETTIDAPSKLQIQSGKNNSEISKDGDMGINETANSRSLETPREVQSSSPEKSMGRQQLQEIRSTTSQQDNVKKSTNALPLRSGTEQQNKDNLPTEEAMNNRKAPREASYEEKSSSDTQQDK